MRHTSLLLVLILASVPAAAQSGGDDWSSFPPAGKTAPPTPAPAVTPAPAAAPAEPKAKAEAPKKPAAPAPAPAKARADERLKAAVAAAEGDARVVSQEERFVPGTEPHSPATWGRKVADPANARVAVGQVGIGTLLVPSARMGTKGVVRVGFMAEYLTLRDFPVRSAQNIRSGITFAASFQPLDWGEAYVSYSAAANTNNLTSPNLIQALGDLSLGFKGGYQVAKGLHVGGDLRLLSFSGVGNQSLSNFAVGIRPTLLGTYDVRAASPNVPLIATLGLGFTFDSSGGLVRSQRLSASEEFALGTNKYNRFNTQVALEAPLPVATPYLEYSLSVPLGAGGQLVGPDGVQVPVTAVMAQTLGVGAKVTALKDLTLLAGMNFGLSQRVGLGVPATPPWNLYLGASFAIDPFQRGESRIVETVKERLVKNDVAQAPTTSRITGQVLDSETKQPIAGVIITAGANKPSATDAQGTFQTVELADAPTVALTAARDGYKPASQTVALEPSKASVVQLLLETDVKKATFEVSTVTAKKKPQPAQVSFKGPVEHQATTEATPLSVELPAGQYTVTVNAEGFLSQTRDVQVPPGGKLAVAFTLLPEPKKKLVIFKGDKLEILQQVHFASGKATILADSFSLLAQVVDAVVKNGVKRLRVEGHTDNRGKKDKNQKLSDDRARAVADHLIAQGIDASRVESVGYGDSKPIAPNLTARGRELNRRVEFLILEK